MVLCVVCSDSTSLNPTIQIMNVSPSLDPRHQNYPAKPNSATFGVSNPRPRVALSFANLVAASTLDRLYQRLPLEVADPLSPCGYLYAAIIAKPGTGAASELGRAARSRIPRRRVDVVRRWVCIACFVLFCEVSGECTVRGVDGRLGVRLDGGD